MKKRDLTEKIAKENNLRQSDVKLVVDNFLDEIVTLFKKGEMIQLRGFGTFFPYHKKQRKYKVARLNEEREMPGRTTLKFRPSRQIIIYEDQI